MALPSLHEFHMQTSSSRNAFDCPFLAKGGNLQIDFTSDGKEESQLDATITVY